MTKRLAIVAHYDPRDEVAAHVLRQLEQLSTQFDEVVLASPAALSDRAVAAITAHARLVRRANYGHDFGSWRDVLEQYDWGQAYDEVLLTNDSYVGFFRPLSQIMHSMSTRSVEMWGLTRTARHTPHIQSYFLHFTRPALHSQAFRRFWADAKPAPDRTSAIMDQEVGISRAMTSAGFALGSYFEPTRAERLRGNLRGVHWLHKRQQFFPARFDRSDDPYFDVKNRRKPAEAENLNWSSAFADATLDAGRLPVIKLDTLRYDPYWLGARALLNRLEQRYAQQMAGVREYLSDTQPSYARRPYENYGFASMNPLQRVLIGYGAPLLGDRKGSSADVKDS